MGADEEVERVEDPCPCDGFGSNRRARRREGATERASDRETWVYYHILIWQKAAHIQQESTDAGACLFGAHKRETDGGGERETETEK